MEKGAARHRLIILGAGFSRPAGFPLANDLWKEIGSIAKNFREDRREIRFTWDLENYIDFVERTTGQRLAAEEVNFEEFMRFLDIEHFLALRGSDTWSVDGNEGTVVTKHLIGSILARHMNALPAIPDLYLDFAQRLQPGDTVITFNYDTLLEAALEAVGKPYRLYPTRYTEIHTNSGTVDLDANEVVLLKVHGSIDWFDRSSFERQLEEWPARLPPPQHIIFSNQDQLALTPVLDGPHYEQDPLARVYRARNLRRLYEMDLLFRATPRILPPSATKLLYANDLSDFWRGMRDAGVFNGGMAIIGFSLPTHDDYARQIIYSIVRNYQENAWGEEQMGRIKTPLAIVDRFTSDQQVAAFRERYRFVDWDRAELIGTGFDQAALDVIFA